MRDLFHCRWFRVAALLWVVGFFVVFVPAHRRGVVRLPGHDATLAAADQPGRPYCPLCVMVPSGVSEQDRPPADAPVNCAVCFLKANLDLPPVVLLAPRFVAEIDYLLGRFEAVESPLLVQQYTQHGRAPPASLSA